MIIPARGWIVPIVAVVVLISVRVRAETAPALPIDCPTIRALVAYHGESRALIWALKQGFTLGQINAARRCLRQQ